MRRVHSGTTAIVSISIFAAGSTRAVTPTTAIAGKFGPISSRQAAPISASAAPIFVDGR